MQFDVMAEMRDKHKVQVKRWTRRGRSSAFEKAWLDVLEEDRPRTRCSRRSPTTTSTYRKKYAIWGDAQFMKPTYQK